MQGPDAGEGFGNILHLQNDIVHVLPSDISFF